MPGIDGQTTTKLIRQFEKENELPQIPIIAITADKTEGFRLKCLEAGY